MKFTKVSKISLKDNFHALTHRDFRYYWIGQCVSLVGTWAQSIGQSWLILTLTDSPFLLGLVSTLQFLPVMLLSLFAGVIVDRFPKRKILLVTQSVSMILAFILSALVFSGSIRYWHVIVLAFLLGLTNTIDMPTRQSFVIEIAGKEDLMNAIALNSATFNLARIVGPAIGAMLMSLFGAGWCFFINGTSFLAVILGLYKIKGSAYVRKIKEDSNIFKEIMDGVRYISGTPLLLETVSMVTVMGIFVFNFNVLVPVFTRNVLHMGERTYGLLLSSLGAGSLLGALTVSVRSKRGPKKTMMFISGLVVASTLILIGLGRNYYGAVICLIISGVFNIFFSTTANSTLQINSKDEYRGRVMSIYTLVFTGSAPIGSLFVGYVSDRFGADISYIVNGILTLALILLISLVFKKRAALIDIAKQ